MPSASLDSDEKYEKLLLSYLNLCSSKKNDSYNKSNCKLFDNILESLIWLTEHKDKNLLEQQQQQQENLSNFNDEKQKTNVLITGSLYLVGLALKVLKFKTD
jgi:folylpolyglutamate synthase/dihydropteroate synthase